MIVMMTTIMSTSFRELCGGQYVQFDTPLRFYHCLGIFLGRQTLSVPVAAFVVGE